MALSPLSSKVCAVCYTKDLPKTSLCSRCKKIWYCSRQCQTQDWPKHQLTCKVVILPSNLSSPVVCPFFLKVEGKNLRPNQRVLIFGTCHDVDVNQYPKEPLAEIKKCDVLVSEFLVRLTAVEDSLAAIRQIFMEKRQLIQKKFFQWDEDWFNSCLKKLSYNSNWIEILKGKSQEIRQDQTQWLSKLSSQLKEQIQSQVADYSTDLSNSDPYLIENILSHKSIIREQSFHSAEFVVVKHFQSEGRQIIELDDEDEIFCVYMRNFLDFVKDYSLEGCLEDIKLYLKELTDDTILKTENQYAQYVNNRRFFDFQTFLKEELTADVIMRHQKWMPKILSAIHQNQSVAIFPGYDHLKGELGIVRSLEREGFSVRQVTKEDLRVFAGSSEV